MNKYLYIYPFIEIVEYNFEKGTDDNIKKFVLQPRKQQIYSWSSDNTTYDINEFAVEIILELNGTKTFAQIVNDFKQKYCDSDEVISNNLKEFLNLLSNNYGFKIAEQETPELHEIELIKYKNIYPTVYSIELTNRCNLKCRHCYGNFSNKRDEDIPKDKLRPLFKSMREVGGLVVELTGGDPSVYPYTADAIDTAFDVGFKSLMVLTNGIHLDDGLVDSIIRHKENIFVQIDLHSLNEEYFNWFTQSKNALPKVKNNIDRLVKSDVKVRVCSIFTQKNYHELLDITEWAHEHGAKLYAPSIPVELGRARENSEMFFSNQKQLKQFNELLRIAIDRYPNFIRMNSDEIRIKRNNCGALLSQCSIRTNGDIKLCTMDTGEYFNLNIGNVFKNSIKECFDNNREFIYEFSQLVLPKRESEECNNCSYSAYCDNCLVRGLLSAQKIKEKCKWYQNCVSPKIKEHFPV